jgi:uracil-DNA glycosylase
MSQMNPGQLPPSWAAALAPEFEKPYFTDLISFLEEERASATVYPPPDQVFSAFHLTPFDEVRVLILGQDPYHGPGQAHGLAFSVCPGVTPPPSLANLFKELVSDTGCELPKSGSLIPWTRSGVMLLNAVLTVRAGEAASHQGKGWEKFTDAVIRALSARQKPLVFVLWGAAARKKAKLIDGKRHRILEGIHPSPLSAHQGFFGSKPFSKINALLKELGQPPIDWDLKEAPPAQARSEAPAQAKSAAPAKGKAREKQARRERGQPAPHPAVLALAEALDKNKTPPVDVLAQVLRLQIWDELRTEERQTAARAVERVLPAGFAFTGLSTCSCGPTIHEVASYAQGGARFILVPGGDVRLGWGRGPLALSSEQRDAWRSKFQKDWRTPAPSPEEWLDPYLSPGRNARLVPFLLEVSPDRRARDHLAGQTGADPHALLLASLAGTGLRLPTSDEWEHACAAGARTLFRWGDTWPGQLRANERGVLTAPGAFGLPLGTQPGVLELTDDPDVFRGGDGGRLSKDRRCFEDEVAYASSFVYDLRRLDDLEEGVWRERFAGALVRRARSVFPYAKR